MTRLTFSFVRESFDCPFLSFRRENVKCERFLSTIAAEQRAGPMERLITTCAKTSGYYFEASGRHVELESLIPHRNAPIASGRKRMAEHASVRTVVTFC